MLELETWRDHGRGQRRLACVWLLAMLIGVGLAVRRAWVSDDIYITFRYCDNVLAGNGPVYNPGERSEGYTHFLWFLMLTLGRSVGIEARYLGKYLGLPAYLGCLFLLVRLSSRLFPRRGGLWGIPVAALAWALHADARLFASGGLETAFFTLLLLLGFEFVTLSQRPRRGALAAWALALCTLVRPDGLLYSLLGGLYLAWRGRSEQRLLRDFVLVWVVLVVPLFTFRMLYYGYPLPNPYYAKSGGSSYWVQGWFYLRLYFTCYFALLLGFLAWIPMLVRKRAVAALQSAVWPCGLALVASALTASYVARVGGDFMFGRFLIPITALLLLLCEFLVQLLPRRAWRLGATAVFAALIALGGVIKLHYLHDKYTISGIVDEPQFYPDARLDDIRAQCAWLRDCLAGTNAVVMVQGGQASMAYYARFPVALERYGLTDVHIAHSAIAQRGRPGHEKSATPDYIYERHVALRFHGRPVRNLPVYAKFALRGLSGEIIVYDRTLMDQLKRCEKIQFLDFPIWLERYYIPVEVPRRAPAHLAADWNAFQRFYFLYNADPEHLQEKLRTALASRGLQNIPSEPLAPDLFEDSGRPATPD